MAAPLLPRQLSRGKAPPIKSQGIKTKLVPFILGSVQWDGRGRWIEPFLGSGAIALNLAPPGAILSDSNYHLVRVYQAIQTHELTASALEEFLQLEGRRLKRDGENHYYQIRDRFNASHSPFDFIFLNRACFNGVIRFNGKGRFNVPFCRKPDRFAQAYVTKICNQVKWASLVMQGKDWLFLAQDWRKTVEMAREGDFLYVDPPYFGRHTDYFNRWTEADADELSTVLKRLTSGFAYSTWKANRYRSNDQLWAHFAGYPILTFEHFYHVGSTEALRNSIDEALVISPGHLAASPWNKPARTTSAQETLAL